jgi:hypothetical protein
MKSPEEYKKEVYQELIELIGERKAKKYMNEDYFSPTAIGLTIFFAKLKIYIKKSPIYFIVVLIIIIAALTNIIRETFFY